jgi:hypothetical protein
VLYSNKIPLREILLSIVFDRQVGQCSNGGHTLARQVLQNGTRKSPFIKNCLNPSNQSTPKMIIVAEVPPAERL